MVKKKPHLLLLCASTTGHTDSPLESHSRPPSPRRSPSATLYCCHCPHSPLLPHCSGPCPRAAAVVAGAPLSHCWPPPGRAWSPPNGHRRPWPPPTTPLPLRLRVSCSWSRWSVVQLRDGEEEDYCCCCCRPAGNSQVRSQCCCCCCGGCFEVRRLLRLIVVGGDDSRQWLLWSATLVHYPAWQAVVDRGMILRTQTLTASSPTLTTITTGPSAPWALLLKVATTKNTWRGRGDKRLYQSWRIKKTKCESEHTRIWFDFLECWGRIMYWEHPVLETGRGREVGR